MKQGIPGLVMVMAVVLVSWPMMAHGQLAFEASTLEAKVDLGDETLEVNFPFTNEGSSPVTIVKIESTCGCLTATADVNEVAPGGKGTVTGVFSVGTRTGEHQKALTVKTLSDGKEGSQELKVKVDVPEIFELTPELLTWEVGGALEKRSFVLKILHDKPIHVLEAKCSRAGFKTEIVEVEKGKEYRFEMTPSSLAIPLMGILRIETDCEFEKHRRKLAFVSVKRASKAAPKSEG